jgi:diphthamide synthase subunit DPH2
MSDEDKNLVESWEITSDRADAIHYILATVDCPKEVRTLINLLIGISHGTPDFETTQTEIATRLKNADDKSLVKNVQQQVKRMHRQLREWQKENNLNLIEYEQGYRNKEGTIHFKSHYYLHILKIADEVVALAQKERLWSNDRAKALNFAALELQYTFAPSLVIYHKYRAKKLSWSKEVSKNIRASITHMRKVNQILDENKGVILIERKVIQEYEETLKELKKRLLHNAFLNEED